MLAFRIRAPVSGDQCLVCLGLSVPRFRLGIVSMTAAAILRNSGDIFGMAALISFRRTVASVRPNARSLSPVAGRAAFMSVSAARVSHSDQELPRAFNNARQIRDHHIARRSGCYLDESPALFLI